MHRHHSLVYGILAWAAIGAIVAFGSLGSVNDDARVLVVVASVVGPLLAVGSARQFSLRRDRLAGALLVVSAVVTPTYFAYALNLVPLGAGLYLVVAPRARPASPPCGDSSLDTAGSQQQKM